MKEAIFGKTLTQLEEICLKFGMPRYTSLQITHWLYKKNVSSFDEMTNLSRTFREKLNENYCIGKKLPVKIAESIDGTKKYLFPAGENKAIETAYIPDSDRHTLCVSSQIGCKMGCVFCATGKQGFQGQLSSGEIINQMVSIPEFPRLTNLVYMGMGEPFDNLTNVMQSLEIITSEWGFGWSPRRITVSTIGVIPGIRHFMEKSNCHLAVSLHSPFDEERASLVPYQSRYPLKEVLKVIKSYDFGRQRRISFEYIMFEGLNVSMKHVNELARILNGIRCRINLIRFHEIPGFPYKSPDDNVIQQFINALKNKGFITTLRASRGEDIQAACGLLAQTRISTKV